MKRTSLANWPCSVARTTDLLGDWWTPLVLWGDRWLADPAGPPVTMHHSCCGRDTEAQVVCARCKQPLRSEETVMLVFSSLN